MDNNRVSNQNGFQGMTVIIGFSLNTSYITMIEIIPFINSVVKLDNLMMMYISCQ